MGNHALLPHLFSHSSPNRYSHIDSKSNHEQDLENSQLDEWDSSWKDVTHQNIYYRIEYGKFHTFRNDITTQQIQRYRTVLNHKNDFEKWKEMVHWRSNCQYLAKIEHFSLQNKGQVCISQFQLNLFIERIPLRLIDLTDIPYPQNLYFLLCVLKGFKYIFSSPFAIKSFRVTESMICVNTEGEVKVWFNPNLSQFEPIKQNYTTQATQEDILRGLIDLVQQNTDQRDYPYPFREYLFDKNILINGNYNSIIQQVYTYAKDMKVAIPKYAFSVRDILNKDFLNTNKLDSQNSFSHKPHFSHQTPPIKDASLSALNSLELQPSKKQPVHFDKQTANAESFPYLKTRGLVSTNQLFINHNFPTIPELPSFNANSQNHQQYQNPHQTQIQTHNYFKNEPTPNFTQPELKNNSPGRKPLTDREFRNENINEHLMKINKIGNNIIQFHQPGFSYQPNQMPPISPQNASRRHVHSLQKPYIENYRSITGPVAPHPAPPGYKIVQRKIIHPVNFDPLKDSKIPSYSPLHQSRSFPPQNEFKNYQIPQNQTFSNIERVNSTNISFPKAPKSQNSDFQTRSNSAEKVPLLNLGATIRPEQLSNTVQIERINPQSSYKTFLSSQNPHENIRKTNSFKNNLIKHQSEDKEVERAVSDVKYFTKKDLQETLDPQIAGDLVKYLAQQV